MRSGIPEGLEGWALVDVETSGLRSDEHRVLAVAVITLDREGRQTNEYSTLLDPGCDPGPVHIHGLTRERLRGWPTFDRVAPHLATLLAGRVMVAHNAPFDYGFLAREFARIGSVLPVRARLCTLSLNRLLSPPTPNLKLATLARHYGVRQRRAHDALDDTRVLTGILHGSLDAARASGVDLPIVACPPPRDTGFQRLPPKTSCPYRNPGRFDGVLRQGMKVAFSGETAYSRAELIGRASAAGLDAMGSVSRQTSLLVTDAPGSGTTKARRARAEGVPVVGEERFLRLLTSVLPGVRRDAVVSERPVPSRLPPVVGEGPSGADVDSLRGRRVLVLGGPYEEAQLLRKRVLERGGTVALYLSAGVSDLVAFPDAGSDRRVRRAVDRGIPVHVPQWLDAPATTGTAVPPGSLARRPVVPVPAPIRVPRGGVVDLPGGVGSWTVALTWGSERHEIDLVAVRVGDDDRVSGDADVVFYHAPRSPDGAVRLSDPTATARSVTIDVRTLPERVRAVVLLATVDTGALAGAGPLEVACAPASGTGPVVGAVLDTTTERTLIVARLYRRGGTWRFRVVGQGGAHGLGEALVGYGVDVAD